MVIEALFEKYIENTLALSAIICVISALSLWPLHVSELMSVILYFSDTFRRATANQTPLKLLVVKRQELSGSYVYLATGPGSLKGEVSMQVHVGFDIESRPPLHLRPPRPFNFSVYFPFLFFALFVPLVANQCRLGVACELDFEFAPGLATMAVEYQRFDYFPCTTIQHTYQ